MIHVHSSNSQSCDVPALRNDIPEHRAAGYVIRGAKQFSEVWQTTQFTKLEVKTDIFGSYGQCVAVQLVQQVSHQHHKENEQRVSRCLAEETPEAIPRYTWAAPVDFDQEGSICYAVGHGLGFCWGAIFATVATPVFLLNRWPRLILFSFVSLQKTLLFIGHSEYSRSRLAGRLQMQDEAKSKNRVDADV